PEHGTALTLAGADPAQAVRERFLEEWHFLVKDNPLTQEGGVLRPAKPDSSIVAFLAVEAFRLGFADTWAMPAPEESLDLVDIVASAAGLKRPTKGERILEGGGGRLHFRSDMGSLGEKVLARVEEAERAMAALGYALVGDLACTAMSDIIFRGYAKPDGDTWAVLIEGTFGPDQFHFITRFENGAALTTNRSRLAVDRADKKDFRTAHPKVDLATLHAHHETRKAELSATYGRPLPVTPELPAFAWAIDDALQRDAV
ncbi:MAG: hypothetical protein ACREKB_07305, partial [Candidatus Rokuibacteriota bacterium]